MALADAVPGRSAALSAATRKRRHAFYVAGSAIAAAGIMTGTMPLFVAFTPILVAKGLALFGAMILAVGRFSPDHVLRRFPPALR
jgi:hypothetical protein